MPSEISCKVKYSIFFFNFFFWLFSVILVGVGLYAMIDQWDIQSTKFMKFDSVFDVLLNVGFMLVLVGTIGKVTNYPVV